MGWRTVEEWRAQAQQCSPVPGGWEELSNDGSDVDSDFEYEAAFKYDKPLPASPGSYRPPPTPPPKRELAHSAFNKTPTEGRVNKLLEAIRCRGRSHPREDWSQGAEEAEKHRRFRDAEFIVVTPVMMPTVNTAPGEPWSQSNERSTKTAFKWAAGTTMYQRPTADECAHDDRAVEVFVSTKTTTIASAPDPRRPRVFFPRSSSLLAGMNHTQASVERAPLTHLEADREEEKPVQPCRSLPAVPSHRISPESTKNMSECTPRIRPLPIPTRSS